MIEWQNECLYIHMNDGMNVEMTEWNIVLRDRREGGYGFCKPAGVISSQGSEAPEGWNGSQGLAKAICLPIGDHATVLL